MTERFGVVGDPVAHSLSPAMHNAAFAAAGIDAEYRAYRVPGGRDDFDAFVGTTTCRGLSVTIPHKVNALGYAGDNVEALAARIGAANTLILHGERPYACNTDYAAILDSLTTAMDIERSDLAGVRVAVLGAGGAARAAVAGLAANGAQVTIYNRTRARAAELAAEFALSAGAWEKRVDLDADVIVNTTSVGLAPDVDATPLASAALHTGLVVFESIYNPLETRLLREARSAGCVVVDGLDMFVRQGAAQFELFTGVDPPVAVMRAAVLGHLRA